MLRANKQVSKYAPIRSGLFGELLVEAVLQYNVHSLIVRSSENDD